MSDVAIRSGVSRAAVSYVLRGRTDKSISDATRSRILAAADELGYVANAAATSLSLGHSNVAFLVLDETFTGEVSERTLRSMTQGVRELGFNVLVHTMRSEDELLDVVTAVRPVAVVLLTFITANTRRLLRRGGVDYVVGLPSPNGVPGPADRVGERAIGAVQAGHLLDRSHRVIAYVVPDHDSPRLMVARSRLLGAQDECTRRGAPAPLILTTPSDRAIAASQVEVARAAGVTAIAAYCDQAALAVLAASIDLGLTVPGDIAIVGADNSPVSALATPQISTVVMSFAAEGAVPTEWLRRAMAPKHGVVHSTGTTLDVRKPDLSDVAPGAAQPLRLPPITVIPRATT